MRPKLMVVFLLFGTGCAMSYNIENANQRFNFPKRYDMEDFNKCSKSNSKFCTLTLELKPKDPEGALWQYIEHTTKNAAIKFNKSVIYRGVCVPQDQETKSYLKKYEINFNNNEQISTHLTADIRKIQCMIGFSMAPWDYVVVIFFGLYLLLIIVSTRYDISQRKARHDKTRVDKHNMSNQYLLALSGISSWEKLTAPNQNEDYKRLKCIQALRLYNQILIIIIHSFTSWMQSYLSYDAVNLIEKLMEFTIVRALVALSGLIIQTNILISSWLTTNQIYEIHKKHGSFSIRNGLILIINRYFRLFPSIVILVLFSQSHLLQLSSGPNSFPFQNMAYHSCHKNWLSTFLMTSNIHFTGDVCFPGLWYLAIDIQLMVANIIFLYLKLKFNWNGKKALCLLFAISSLFHGSMIYRNNLNIIWQYRPDYSKMDFILFDKAFYHSHSSFYSNWSTSIVGIFFGTAYFKMKSKQSDFVGLFNTYWWVGLFTALPILTLSFAIIDFGHGTVLSAVLGSVIKPIFALGIGIGILGISFTRQGLLKKICEWRHAVNLGDFVFSVYFCHFFVVFGRVFTNSYILNFKDALRDICVDLLFSFVVGIIFMIIVVQPGFTIQKLLLPQIRQPQNNKDK